MKYPVAERFKAPQGEGLFTGTQMAFIRLVGCSVGKRVCTHCDTDFDQMYPNLGGGLYTPMELVEWAKSEPGCSHICITGGEPLDRDIRSLIMTADNAGVQCHIETSGTKKPDWLDLYHSRAEGMHGLQHENGLWTYLHLWITVSPKPGYLPEMIEKVADEVKMIIGGLGDGEGWPDIVDAVRWQAEHRKLVYIQPRNDIDRINEPNLKQALAIVAAFPQVRLSCQMHKMWGTR